MNKQIFRQKSIDRVSSPEQLNEYIRVSNPGLWLVLLAIVVLLAGACVWGIFGHLDSRIAVAAVGENGQMLAYIKEANIDSVEPGMTVDISDSEYVLASISEKPIVADENFDEYALHVGNIQSGEWIYIAMIDGEYAEGIHSAEIVVESISPMSFLWN